jgi:hypothetical protein
MRKLVQVSLLAFMAVLATASSAFGASAPWTANPGSSFSGGVVTLDNTGGSGTSYENANLEIPVQNGDTISFEYFTTDVTCAGGTPRVFIQGGAYNTFDQDPAGPGACGTDSNGDGWFTVTGTISGITNGFAGHTGIVNDNPSDPGTILVRNLTIAGVEVFDDTPAKPTSKSQCKKGGWRELGYRNQGQCIKAYNQARKQARAKARAKAKAKARKAS